MADSVRDHLPDQPRTTPNGWRVAVLVAGLVSILLALGTSFVVLSLDGRKEDSGSRPLDTVAWGLVLLAGTAAIGALMFWAGRRTDDPERSDLVPYLCILLSILGWAALLVGGFAVVM